MLYAFGVNANTVTVGDTDLPDPTQAQNDATGTRISTGTPVMQSVVVAAGASNAAPASSNTLLYVAGVAVLGYLLLGGKR